MKLHLCLAALLLASIQSIPAYSQDHPFSVADDIGMVRFNDQFTYPGFPGSNVSASPDGMHFAVVTSRGILKSDKIESNLYVFDKETITDFLNGAAKQPPIPRRIATIISFPHREEPEAYAPVIKDLRWAPDMKTIYFKGETETGAYQLFAAGLDGEGYRALTKEDESVGRYDVSNDLIVYTASHPGTSVVTQADFINSDAQVLTGHDLIDTLFYKQNGTIAPETFTLSVLRMVGGDWKATASPHYSVTEIPYMSFLFPFSMSPKKDMLIGMTPVDTIPDSWKNYEPALGFEHLRLYGGDHRSTNLTLITRPQEYTVIDLRTGAMTPLIEAPNARVLAYPDPNLLAWSTDGKRVLVTNTFLPLVEHEQDTPAKRTRPCALASVDLPSLVTRCFFFAESGNSTQLVQTVNFEGNNDEVIVRTGAISGNLTTRHYHLQDDAWHPTASVTAAPGNKQMLSPNTQSGPAGSAIQLAVKQDLNDPPTLWASNVNTNESRQIWDPNPQLRHMRYGQASVYHWKDWTGYEWSGVLVKPVDYVAGRKYPAVLQMYSVADDEFMTDGLYPTAFAARELASAGFFVLQIRKKPTRLTEADAADSLKGYQSAIQSLSDAGFIDRHKVGVVGFSWTCWYVVNALIKDPTLFAAATIADGLDNGYMQYLLFGASSNDIRRQMESIRGATPFGDGLLRWIQEAPGFHLDQVETPVRIEAIGPSSVLQEWELYSSLQIQGKQVDLIYFPQGTHIHQKPLERLESQQGNVDWLRFWLENYEDPAPAKRREYERWNSLRCKQLRPAAN